MKPLKTYYYQARNLFWYHLGYELFNTSNNKKLVKVQKVNGKQVWSNPYRTKPYSLDDAGWKRVVDYPKLFI